MRGDAICVIADRFSDSTTVYQGAARKLDQKIVQQLNIFAVDGCVPDITFVLEVDLQTARARMQGPRRPDRMEQETDEFLRAGATGLSPNSPNKSRIRIVVIDGSQSAKQNERVKIWDIISQRFSRASGELALHNSRPETT